MPKAKNWTHAMKAPFMTKAQREVAGYAQTNGFRSQGQTSAGADLDLVGTHKDEVVLCGSRRAGTYQTVSFPLATNASLSDQVFFITPSYYTGAKIKKIQCIYATADGAANTAAIYKVADGSALAVGANTMTSTFDLNTTTNTVQTATLSADANAITLAAKDRLGIRFASAVTSLAGLLITITFDTGCVAELVKFNMQANGDLADQAFFIANRPMRVLEVLYCHSTKGTNGSDVNLQVVKDTGTDAPGAGTDLLTDNTNAGFNCKAANDTVQTGTLVATAATLKLAAGNRLSVDFAGTLTALAGVVVVVALEPMTDRREIVYNLAKNANLVDQAFFIADRVYEIVDASAVWSTASAGATNVQLVLDTGTNAPGAGTDLLSNDSSAGFQTDQTANTVEYASWVNTRANYLFPGDRLSVDYSGVLTSLVGVVVSVSLKAA